jgi:hypothetical protein
LQRSSYFGRRNLNQENLSSLDDDSDVFTSRHGLESFGNSRFYRNSSRVSSDGLAEVGSLLLSLFHVLLLETYYKAQIMVYNSCLCTVYKYFKLFSAPPDYLAHSPDF